jgi:hypothetical protein
MAEASAAIKQPNSYALSGDGIKIDYSSTSVDGSPRFRYEEGSETRDFKGKEIRTEETELGTLVTVTTKLTPDRGSTTFTLLIPRINLGTTNSADVTTNGITTMHNVGVVGPQPTGQMDTYTVHPMKGKAEFRFF